MIKLQSSDTIFWVRGLFWLASGMLSLGGRTTVGMMGLWSVVSSSVGSSKIWTKVFQWRYNSSGKSHRRPTFQPRGSLPAKETQCCIIHEPGRLRTQPVALNILRSRGSPESSPSILVSEWQVAMQVTNREVVAPSWVTFDSGGEKLQQRRVLFVF